MKRSRFFIVAGLLVVLAFGAGCDNPSAPMLKGVIASYSDYGAAILDITETDMTKAGFTLGDDIGITVDDKKEIAMPYFNGYYIPNGMSRQQLDALIGALTNNHE